MESKRKQDLDEKEWCQKVERWRSWLNSDKRRTAEQSIQAIDDPLAAKGLMMALGKAGPASNRGLFIEPLAKIGTPAALKTLCETALFDADHEVRMSCLDHLEKRKNPDVVAYFVSQLRNKHSNNQTINDAAVALGRLKDPSAIGSLIDVLITIHKYKIKSGSQGPGSMSATFGNGPGAGGLSVGDTSKTVAEQVTNQSVLDALVALTGQNFNFDVQAWRYWHATQKRGGN
jgi:hypothetical protein